MKHLSILVLFTFIIFSALAQEVKNETGINSNTINSNDVEYNGGIISANKPIYTAGVAGTKATTDTLTELYDRIDSMVIFTYSASGSNYLLTGTNNRYVFVGTRYDFSGYAQVKGALIAYGYQNINGNPDNYNVLLYHTNTNGIAAGESITSASFSGTQITTNGFTHVPFTNYGGVQNNFAIMVQTQNSNATGDSLDFVAIYAGNANTGAGEQRALAFSPGSNPGSFSSGKIANDFTNFNSDIMILPILEIAAAGVDTKLDGMTFKGVSPNPASANAALEFSLDKTEDVTIMLLDMNGRIVKEVANERMQAGNHTVNVNLTDVKAGVYFYTIVAGKSKMASKLIVE